MCVVSLLSSALGPAAATVNAAIVGAVDRKLDVVRRRGRDGERDLERSRRQSTDRQTDRQTKRTSEHRVPHSADQSCPSLECDTFSQLLGTFIAGAGWTAVLRLPPRSLAHPTRRHCLASVSTAKEGRGRGPNCCTPLHESPHRPNMDALREARRGERVESTARKWPRAM
jgi:hypothetical protein